MKTNFFRLFACVVGALSLGSLAWGYSFLKNSSGQKIPWPAGQVPMQIKVDNTIALSDGSTRAATIQIAVQLWNAQIFSVQLVPHIVAVGTGADNNDVNEIFFTTSPYGYSWDDDTLAITTTWSIGDQRAEADILFNATNATTWDSYRGPFRGNDVYDVRRVALHELGHVLGLDHPDENNQSVTAMMNSIISDVDALQEDDIQGAQTLYGVPHVAPILSAQPYSVTVDQGLNASFFAAAPSLTPPTFHWQRLPVGGVWANLGDNSVYSGTGTSSLSVISCQPGMSGDQFRCVISNAYGSSTSQVATLTVNLVPPPVISGLPSSLTLEYGDSLVLSASNISNQPITSAWYKDGLLIAGATTTALIKASLTPADSGQYIYRATNSGGTSTFTVAVTVQPARPPVIAGLPSSLTLEWGGYFGFDAFVTGTGPISFQWRKDGVVIPGAIDTYYSRTQVTNADAGSYTLTAVNPAASVSVEIVVRINAPIALTISYLPSVVDLVAGESFSLSPTVDGSTPASFQWSKNAIPIAGEVSQNFSIDHVSGGDQAQYTLSGSNGAGTVISQAVTLAVYGPFGQGALGVFAGDGYSLYLTADGTLLATGSGSVGQLGNGTFSIRNSPVPVATGVVAASAGGSDSLSLKSDGTVWAAGWNYFGEFGNGSKSASGVPVQVTSNTVAVAEGGNFSLFLKSDATLWAAGRNTSGQLGDGGQATENPIPIQVAANVTAVAAGPTTGMFVKSDGTLWGMGEGQFGQMGNYINGSAAPVQLAAGVVSVSVGRNHTLFIKTDATLWAMGNNDSGQLGDGSKVTRLDPVQVATDVVAVSVGDTHSLFLKTDGTLWGMGDSALGQLGLVPLEVFGAPYNPPVYPTPVQIDLDVAAISAGQTQSLYLKNNGSSWAMGMNNLGALGDGTYDSRTTPKQIASGPLVLPSVPASLVASHGPVSEGILLSWKPTLGATHYEVWRHTANDLHSAVRIGRNLANPLFFDLTANANVTYYYWAKAVNPAGTTTSASLSHRLNPATARPVFTTQPQDRNGPAEGSVTFSVVASGTPAPTFQWQKNGVNLSGATGTTYTLARLATTDAGSYSVVATNAAGIALSAGARLTVDKKSAVITLAGLLSTYDGSPKTVTATTAPAGLAVEFNYAGSATPPTTAGSYAVVATIVDADYSGTASGTFVIDRAAKRLTWPTPAPIAAGTPLSEIQLNAKASVPGSVSYGPALGVSFQVGTYTISANFTPTDLIDYYPITAFNTLTVVAPIAPSFTSQPASQTTVAGYGVTLTAVATGLPAPTYQWKKNGANISGATTATYVIPSATAGDAASYTVVVTNSAGTASSNVAVLTVGSTGPGAVAAQDFDRDGQSDLVWQNTLTGERSFWLMNGTILKQGVSLGTFAPDWTVVASGDFNRDDQVDLVWQNTITGECSIWLMNGTALNLGVDLGIYSIDWMIVGTGDFNADGQTDIVRQNTVTGERSIWLMNGAAIASEVSLGTVPVAWSIAGVGDMNGDGKPDLIWQNAATGERSAWLMNGPTRTANVSLGVVAKQFQIVGTGDFNRDGKTDLLWTDTETGDRSIWLMNGQVRASTVALASVSLEWSVGRPIFITAQTAHADFTADGLTDLLWQNSATGERKLSVMNGTALTFDEALGTVAPAWVISGTGDFNQDEQPDLVWTNTVTGARAVWLMDGTTMTSNVPFATISPNWVIAAIGDFNFDGKPDLVWTNTTTGERAIWLMNGTVFGSGIALGTIPNAWTIATTADLNGDGKTDLIWQNKSTGECSVWLMNGGTFTAGVALDPLSAQWAIVGSGDFNGDGKADLLLENTVTGERVVRLMNRTTFLSTVSLGTFDTHWSIKN